MENWIDSLKILVWDIIGFIIPGFFIIFLLDIFLVNGINVNLPYLTNVIKEEYILIIVCYIFGFIITSANSIKLTLIKTLKKVFMKAIGCQSYLEEKENISLDGELYKSIKRKIKKIDPEINTEKLTLRELRNILMSIHPSQGNIVYTFMFRSIVYDSLATEFTLILLLVSAHHIFSVNIVKCGTIYTVLYILMLIFIPILNKSRNSFYSRSMRVPFSNIK